MGSGMGFTRGQGYKRKLSMEALFALGAAIGTMLKMGRTTQAAQHAQVRINEGKGFPLMRKFMRPANPAEVRTDYKHGPWGTTGRPGAYLGLEVTGQCFGLYYGPLRSVDAMIAEDNRVYRAAGVSKRAAREHRRMLAAKLHKKINIMRRFGMRPSRFAQKENQ